MRKKYMPGISLFLICFGAIFLTIVSFFSSVTPKTDNAQVFLYLDFLVTFVIGQIFGVIWQLKINSKVNSKRAKANKDNKNSNS
jgi:hypothetical protein